MVNKSLQNILVFGLQAEGGRYPGWGGISMRRHLEFINGNQAASALNFTCRQGIESHNHGVLSTRPGYADSPQYQLGLGQGVPDTNRFAFPSRMLVKFHPTISEGEDGFTGAPQVIKLAGASGNSFLHKYNHITGGWEEIPAIGYQKGKIRGQWYPQHIVYGLPSKPYLVWADCTNGLHVYDGEVDVKYNIPKYTNSEEAITGLAWLEQLDGRLIGAGNFLDAGEGLIVYYSAVGEPDKWQSHQGGGSFPIYIADSRSGASPPRCIWGLATLHGMLIVFTEDMRYVVAGIGTANQAVRDFPGCGCFNGRCIVKYRDRLYWAGKQGVFEWNGNEVVNIGEDIFNDFYNLDFLATHKVFSFIYEDQWWINAKRKNGTYVNYIYDFPTGRWYVWNIPMCAAFSTYSGFTDMGLLYFASPEDARTAEEKAQQDPPVLPYYKHYLFGLDDLNGRVAVYADRVRGDAASRIGDPIEWHWTTGKIGCGHPELWKDFKGLAIRLGTAQSEPLPGGGRFHSAEIKFNLDDESDFTRSLSMRQVTQTPFYRLAFHGADGDNRTDGHFLQLKLSGASTRRLDIKRVYVEYSILGVPEHET